MKIIITEDQSNLIKEGTNNSAKLLGKYYNIEDDGSAYRGGNQIQTYVIIYPKDYDNELTPESAISTCNWEIGYNNELIFKFMTMPSSDTIPLMEYIGNMDDLEQYLEDVHREEAERYVQRLIHRRNNPLKENKNPNKLKRLFSNLLGEDFYNSIIPINDYGDVPSSFDMPKGLYDMMNDHGGSIYYFVINGFPYVYMDMGRHEWFFDKEGRTLRLRHIESMLDYKISDLGFRFRDVIDLSNDQPLNESVDGSEKIKKLLKKVLEGKEFEFSFEDSDSYNHDDGVIEKYTFKYRIIVEENVLGTGSNAAAGVTVIIDDILVDGESVYDGWAEIGFSENVWYIDKLHDHLNDEVFDVFPFSFYPTFYGHSEETHLNESVDKNKKFLTNIMGQDFTNNIKQITSAYNVPYNFYRKGTISLRTIMSYLNSFGPMYLFELDGKKYLYQDRFDKDWFIDEDGVILNLKMLQSRLGVGFGIYEMGLRFRNVIDSFLKDNLNESVDGSEKIKNLLKKVLENNEYEISFDVEDTDFDISFDWDELNMEPLVGSYTIKFYIKVGNVTGEGSNAVASVDVIIVGIEKDGKDFYYNWADNDYSEYSWYIQDFSYKIRDELFSNFPFKIHPTFYGHDEQRKS